MIRGISEKLLTKYRVDQMPNGFEFPIWDCYGRLIGKSVNIPDQNPKYYHIIGEKYKHRGIAYLYNEQILASLFYGKPVVIVEGTWDCLSLIQANIPVMAATTNHLRIASIEKIRRYTDNVVLWFDDDGHGKDGIMRTRKRLDKYNMKYRVYKNNSGKDANDILCESPEAFKEVVAELKEILEGFN